LTSVTELGHTDVTVRSSSLDLDSLCGQWAELRFLADEKAQILSADLSHWNLYQSALSRLMPCLRDLEQCMSAAKDDGGGDVTTKTGSLAEAQKLLEDHQVRSLLDRPFCEHDLVFCTFFYLSTRFLRCLSTDILKTFPHDVTSAPKEALLCQFSESAPNKNEG